MTRKTTRRVHHGRKIDHSITIAAEADAVWQAFADPRQISQWFVDRAEGFAEPGAVVKWYFDSVKHEIPQPVLEAERGRSFVTGSDPEPSVVDPFAGPHGKPWLLEVTLEQQGGSTLLRLVNSGFDGSPEWHDEVEGIDSGWQVALATLKYWLEHHRSGARSHRFVMRPAPEPFDYARVLPFFTTAAGIDRWLGRATRIEDGDVQPGRSVALTLADGSRLDGKVVSRTQREMLFSWPQCDGVLALKTFKAGPAHMVAIDWNAWGPRAGDPDARGAVWAQALERLCGELARR